MRRIVFAFLLISNTYASVWQTENSWNDQFKEEFKQWIASDSVSTTMFTDKNSKYYGIKVDCADVTYALKAVFAFENKLPYQVKNPIYKRGHKLKYWSNSIDRFDSAKEGIPRLIKFANFIGDSLGTETLVYNDSYPLIIKKISSGDMHLYKKKTNANGYTRHAHNIKEVTPTGSFNLIWSNQQRKRENRPMKQAIWNRLMNRPYKFPWGFRRMKLPEDYSNPIETLEDYSIEQFELAKLFDDKQYFKNIKFLLQKEEEDPEYNLKTQLEGLCVQSKERVQIISSGEKFRKSINERCMNYTEFDEYSTPARDDRFLKLFERLKSDLEEYDGLEMLSQVDPDLLSTIQNVFGLSEIADEKYCEVKYISTAEPKSLANVYKGLSTSQFSSHPNDNIHRRWGIKNGKETKCKRFY